MASFLKIYKTAMIYTKVVKTIVFQSLLSIKKLYAIHVMLEQLNEFYAD